MQKLTRNWAEVGCWALGKRWRFKVVNNSMSPTLKPGEEVLVVPISQSTPIMPNDIVVCRHPFIADKRLIKRVSETFYDGGCYLLSDNLAEGSDSRSFGVIGRELLLAKVTSRLW
jgi:nickel-type superoxide dismutase maturation protease